MLDGFLTVGELAKELGIPVWKTRRVADALFKDGIPRVGQRRGRLRPAIRDQARDRRINELLGPRMQNSSMPTSTTPPDVPPSLASLS